MKRKTPRPPTPWFPMVVGAMALFGLCFWLALKPASRESPSPSKPERADWEAIQEVDLELAHLWMDLGISDIHHLEPDHGFALGEGEQWELRVVDVRIPAWLTLSEVAEAIDEMAQDSEIFVEVVLVLESKSSWTAELLIDGSLTHRIILREQAQKLMAKPYIPPEPPEAPLEKPLELAPIPFGPPRPQIAIIVDDLGNAYGPIRSLLEMELPLTLSVFPKRPFSQRIAQEAQARGKEVMLHLPMEPWEYPEKNPGAGALLLSMNDKELERALVEDLRDLPHIRGANNHMGSRFTEDRHRMRKVMEILASQSLYFVDSLTSPRSVGYYTAKEMALSAYRRDVFLDVDVQEEKIRGQFRKLMKIARLQGYAIGICHPYPEMLKILPDLHAQASQEGFQWVTISELTLPGG